MKAPLFSSAHRSSAPVWRRLLPLLALFVSFGTSFTARGQGEPTNSSVTNSVVIIDRGAGNEFFGGKNTGMLPSFNGASLGTFDLTDFSTKLLLNGGILNTQEGTPDVILPDGTTITYRIRRNNADGTFTNFTPGILSLPQGSTDGNGGRTFTNTIANRDILTGLTQGSYSLSIQFTANGINTVTGDDFTLSDPPSGFFRANFLVTGTRPIEPPTSTTWTGGQDDNWFDARNWTNGVPNKNKDATIPDFGSGSTVQYPNIYSDAIKAPSTRETTVTNSDGTTTPVIVNVPGYNNIGSGAARARTLTMNGTSQAQRSITRLVVGELEVYGDFNNQQDSFIPREGTTLFFTGTNQTISGSASGFFDTVIDGGGIKTLTTNFGIKPNATLTFRNGILTTDISNVNVSFVELRGTVDINEVSGRIEGESETTFLKGYLKIEQTALPGIKEDFGNIGLTLTFAGNAPGVVTVTRNTAENYANIGGPGTRPSIRRIFGVRPGNPQTNTGGLNAKLTFRYLDNELTNLNANSGGSTIDESKLALFISTTSGDVFGQLGRDELAGNILVKNNVTAFATFTLSEFTSPLPVTLTSFSAKRAGNNAEISWETVIELNNKGYEVQVSNDGRNFRALTFVPSNSANSNQLVRYRYTDTEAGKTGVRYYRLRQIDLNGADHYYAPKVVTFDGGVAVGKAEVIAFPNPFGQVLSLTANSAAAGPAKLSVTDMTGRVVSQQTVQLNAGTNDVSVPNVANLQSGVYLVRLVLPSGEAKVIRVNKE